MRRKIHEQMDVIGFAVEFGKLDAEPSANVLEDRAHKFDMLSVEHFAPIFWRKNKMCVQGKNTMASGTVFGRRFCHNIYTPSVNVIVYSTLYMVS